MTTSTITYTEELHTGTALVAPLTTIFPDSCGIDAWDFPGYSTDCLPENFFSVWQHWGWYSPGICPESFTPLCTPWTDDGWSAAAGDEIYSSHILKEGETARLCIPDGFTCNNLKGIYDVALSYDESASKYSSVAAIEIRWQSSDIPFLETHPLALVDGNAASTLEVDTSSFPPETSTPTPTGLTGSDESSPTEDTKSSSLRKLGTIMGVVFGVVLGLFGLFVWVIRKRRKRNHAKRSNEGAGELEGTDSGPKEIGGEAIVELPTDGNVGAEGHSTIVDEDLELGRASSEEGWFRKLGRKRIINGLLFRPLPQVNKENGVPELEARSPTPAPPPKDPSIVELPAIERVASVPTISGAPDNSRPSIEPAIQRPPSNQQPLTGWETLDSSSLPSPPPLTLNKQPSVARKPVPPSPQLPPFGSQVEKKRTSKQEDGPIQTVENTRSLGLHSAPKAAGAAEENSELEKELERLADIQVRRHALMELARVQEEEERIKARIQEIIDGKRDSVK